MKLKACWVGLIGGLICWQNFAQNLVVSEMMFHPPSNKDLEFIEVLNAGNHAINLSGYRFITGIEYTFPFRILEPGMRAVVAKDRGLFMSRYPNEQDHLLSGSYSGSLRNEGEMIELMDPFGSVFLSFTYESKGDWPKRARGLGSSMELKDPTRDPNNPNSWRSSVEYGGSPGYEGIGHIRSVVINEILAHTDLPLEDAIELYNPTDETIEMDHWLITDDLSEPSRYRIPPGTRIAPGGYWTVYEQKFNFLNPDIPFSLNGFQGEGLWLISVDLFGNPALFIDEIEFEATENGRSLGRYPNGNGPLVLQSRLSFGTSVSRYDPEEFIIVFRQGKGEANAGPQVGPIVISEILYEPAGADPEYFKITHIGSEPIPLFDPSHPENTWRVSAGVEFQFPESIILSPGEDLYVTGSDPSVFRSVYGIPLEVQVAGPFTGKLDNAGEDIKLYKPDGPQTLPPHVGLVPQIPVEYIEYDNKAPWPVPPSPGVPIRRIDLSAYGNDPANWTSEPAGFTDSDGDGMSDSWEREHGLNPFDPTDALLDTDGDQFKNIDEFIAGTNPLDPTDFLAWSDFEVSDRILKLHYSSKQGRKYTLYGKPSIHSSPVILEEVISNEAGHGMFEVPLSEAMLDHSYFQLGVSLIP